MKGLPRVVELVRVSSDAQHDRGTPDAQRYALDRLREMRPGKILARIDPPHGVSGALPVEQRPDILELRRLVDEHGLDELRVYDLDRLSRAEAVLDRLAVLAICADAGAIIVDASGREVDPRSDAGELTYYLHTLFARQERRRLLARTIAGRQRAARAGKFAGGTLPYGLRWTGTEVVADEERCAVVRRIFEAVANGETPAAIARELNAEGVPSATGRRWNPRRAIDILRKRAYVGVIEQHQGDETYEIRGPVVVDETTWRRANNLVDSRRAWAPGRPPVHPPGLVQGLIRCGVCGQGVHVYYGRREKLRYVCRSRHQPHRYGPPCGAPYREVRLVDEAVWTQLLAVVTDPNVLSASHGTAAEPSSAQWANQVARCERELVRIGGLEADWLRLSRRGLLTMDVLERQLAGVASDRATLLRTAELAREAIAAEENASKRAADMAEMLPELAERLRAAGPENRRPIVEALLRHPGCGITLHADGQIDLAGLLPVAVPKVGAAACSPADFSNAETPGVLAFRRRSGT